MCLAGVVAVQSGYKPAWRSVSETAAIASVHDDAGHRAMLADVAQRLLGIDSTTRGELFLYAHNREDLGEVRDRLAASLVGAV
jgi:hypothetical protein